MNREISQISTGQLFCILLLSRISAEIVYPQKMNSSFPESVAALLIAEALRFLIALPVIIYSRKGNNLHLSVWKKNRFIGWTGAIFGAILLIGASVKTMVHTADFSVKNLLTEGSAAVIFIIGLVFAVFCAFMGAEAFARASLLFLVFASLITVTVYLADIPFMEAVPLREIRFSGLFSATVSSFFRGGDYLIFTALLPFVNKKKPGSAMGAAVLFAVISAAVSVGICVCNALVMRGVFAEYPFTAAASLSDIALFKRLDGIGAAVWSLCALTRSGIMLFSAYAMARSISMRKKEENP